MTHRLRTTNLEAAPKACNERLVILVIGAQVTPNKMVCADTFIVVHLPIPLQTEHVPRTIQNGWNLE